MATESVNVEIAEYTTMDGKTLELSLYRHSPGHPVEVSYKDEGGESHHLLNVDPFDMKVFEAYADAEQEKRRKRWIS